MFRFSLVFFLIILSLACGGGGGGASVSETEGGSSQENSLIHQVNITSSPEKVLISGNLLGYQAIAEAEKDVQIDQEMNIGSGAQIEIQSKSLSVEKPLDIAEGAVLEIESQTVEVQEEFNVEGELIIQ